MKRVLKMLLAVLAVSVASPALASPVVDCPLREAPFSLQSPFLDVLLSPVARGVVSAAAPGRLEKLPPMFMSTDWPSFAAILTLGNVLAFTGLNADTSAALDRTLRALPVSASDKAVRCARYDNDRPTFNLPPGKRRMLLFEKMSGFRDGPSVEAARTAFQSVARRKGWALAVTDKGGAITPGGLRKFDAVIWNNVSGDVLTLSQREALKQYVEGGGGFVAIHGSAGDPASFWDWYSDTLIGARFNSHTMDPHFQDARVVATAGHPLAKGLPAQWTMNDEWYSFKANPKSQGARVVLSLDESSYKPVGMGGADLRMGDHPIAWTKCVGGGRMFYSAIGHRPETYAQAEYVTLLENALSWAMKRGKCGD